MNTEQTASLTYTRDGRLFRVGDPIRATDGNMYEIISPDDPRILRGYHISDYVWTIDSENRVHAWKVISLDATYAPDYSVCANCEGPIGNNTDYLCGDCRGI